MKTYREISDEKLETKETELKDKIFEVQKPTINVYNTVVDLQKLSASLLSPYLDIQSRIDKI